MCVRYPSAQPLTLLLISGHRLCPKNMSMTQINSVTDEGYQCSVPIKQMWYVSVRLNLFCPPGSTYLISFYACRYAGFAAPVPLVRAVKPTDLEHIIHIMHVQVLMQHKSCEVHTDVFEEISGRNMRAFAHMMWWVRILILKMVATDSQNLLWTIAKCIRPDLHCQHQSICFWKSNLHLLFLSSRVNEDLLNNTVHSLQGMFLSDGWGYVSLLFPNPSA